MVKVRFAPSPTGYLHIGGARTCLFNWLFARAHSGQFVLRVEDTDRLRSKKEFLDEILESLTWLGLNWDELFYQSQRFEIYGRHAEALCEAGKAYRAADGSGALFLKMPQKTVEINDLNHGLIRFDTSLIKDQVLIKSDGSPTYNFACVVDDALMGITHIIRGDDHISNTPKQVVIYEALGFTLPAFAHIPMILGKGGGRLSKRTGATAITDYRAMGFLPEALVNYLMLLGWSPDNDQEMICLSEAVKKFDIKNINQTAATFDMDKLLWFNGCYIRAADDEELARLLLPLLRERYAETFEYFDGKKLKDIIRLYKERAATLKDFVAASEVFFCDKVVFDEAAKKKHLNQDLTKEFELLKKKFAALSPFKAADLEEAFRTAVSELGITTKQLIHPLRVAVSGTTKGPGMFALLEALGRETTVERIEEALAQFKGSP